MAAKHELQESFLTCPVSVGNADIHTARGLKRLYRVTYNGQRR